MSSPPPVQLEVEVGDESMEDDAADMIPADRNGDLSKPTEGPHGRLSNIQRWAQLTDLLNADSTGDSKSAEKWRKEDVQPISPSVNTQVHSEVPEATENTFVMWSQPGTSAQPTQLPQDEIESPPRMANSTRSAQSSAQVQIIELEVPAVEDTLPIPEAPQTPTPLPPTPRRRRRLLQNVPSPSRRRTRTQTQSELARQAFVNSDNEWRVFQRKCEEERLRLREIELQQQGRWLELFSQLIVLGNRIANIYQDN